jgi:hypothetical protein
MRNSQKRENLTGIRRGLARGFRLILAGASTIAVLSAASNCSDPIFYKRAPKNATRTSNAGSTGILFCTTSN